MTQVVSPTYTADEMMAVAAARRIADGTVCFVGIGLPSLACNLARARLAARLGSPIPTKHTVPSCSRRAAATAIISSAV